MVRLRHSIEEDLEQKIINLLRDSPAFVGDQRAAEKLAHKLINLVPDNQSVDQSRLAFLEKEVHPTYDDNNCMCGQMWCTVCHG